MEWILYRLLESWIFDTTWKGQQYLCTWKSSRNLIFTIFFLFVTFNFYEIPNGGILELSLYRGKHAAWELLMQLVRATKANFISTSVILMEWQRYSSSRNKSLSTWFALHPLFRFIRTCKNDEAKMYNREKNNANYNEKIYRWR